MGNFSLVALDTDHIKQYVFPTDKLREIRGASSILDRLNRDTMKETASQAGGRLVYANGGSGLFVIASDKAEEFGQAMQRAYREQTKGAGSITYAAQALPEDFPETEPELRDARIPVELELLRYQLQKAKNRSEEFVAVPSHPFMHMCDACGIRYAEGKDKSDEQDPGEQGNLYCLSCLEKRREDRRIKTSLQNYPYTQQSTGKRRIRSPLWDQVIGLLLKKEYSIPDGTERPNDFNDFQQFVGAKGYLGLIYADGNGMGAKMEHFSTLRERHDFADQVDRAVYEAVCEAIQTHLSVEKWNRPGAETLFPFDLLLLGGDDVLMVTPASVAMDVAGTIAKRFHELTDKQHTLSIGVVLAPVKYPFGQLEDLAEETLKYAKTEGAKRSKESAYGDTFINFMTVTGSISQDFKKVYASLHEKDGSVSVNGHRKRVQFYATLRPYTVEQLEEMLRIIREGKGKALGRTKLHQVREAVLKMNLTSSVTEGLGVLRNWRTRQQEFVLDHVYTLGGHYQERYRDEKRPETLFPRVTFPWFADGDDTYRTSLLDFVELYDFVAQDASGPAAQEGEDDAH